MVGKLIERGGMTHYGNGFSDLGGFAEIFDEDKATVPSAKFHGMVVPNVAVFSLFLRKKRRQLQ